MSYPKWWDKTVTLYNRCEDNTGRVQWYKRMLHGCFVKTLPSFVISQGIGTEKSQNILRLRKSNDYLSPTEWKTSILKNVKFTLQNGDIAIIGAVSDNIDEYVSGQRSSDLMKKYPDSAFMITSAVVNDYGFRPHYKITG